MLRRLLPFIAALWLSLLLVDSYPGWRDGVSWYVQRELCHAAGRGWLTEVKFLGALGANLDGWNTTYRPIHFAAENGQTEVVEYLLNEGVSANAEREWFFSPLMAAASNGHADTVRFLLARGAKVNTAYLSSEAGYQHETALDMVNRKWHAETYFVLRRAGARTAIELGVRCSEKFITCD
ncbi:MAG TPA: ankyrin repeat domain-containing protein [Pyrinomonadaceae bacterium]|nr:ankyrin repeat domain-containing protein [Pyrinomonadaceae bacterium]